MIASTASHLLGQLVISVQQDPELADSFKMALNVSDRRPPPVRGLTKTLLERSWIAKLKVIHHLLGGAKADSGRGPEEANGL